MPADSAYIDTSVLGAYYCPEPLSAAAESALRRIKVPVISNLTEIELCSLIARKRRLRELTERQARSILELFEQHVAESSYRRIALTSTHFSTARQLVASMRSTLRTLDALHLAAATAEALPLMTADASLARAARRHKARAITVGTRR